MRYTLGTFFLLSFFWLINSPNDNGMLLFLGIVSVLLVLLLVHRMNILDQEAMPLHLLVKIAPFYLWLVKEIVIGCIYVLKLIVTRNKELTPKIVTLKVDFKDELTEVIFANSITLVPGTMSVKLDKGTIQVHTLSQELADELEGGELVRRLKRLEK